jgi:hypothetical protein
MNIMKCSETDVSKHVENYVGIICLSSDKRKVLVSCALKADNGNWGTE